MIYLDYSATTPINDEVLEVFNHVSKNFVGNSNSAHSLGKKSKDLIDKSTAKIAEILNVKSEEIIYTSGSTESNNLALKGIAFKHYQKGKHIITSKLEHSSIIGPLSYLERQGFEIDFVNLTAEGLIDVDHLKNLLRTDTILVTFTAVDSELGIRQPIEEIGKLLKENYHCFFHVDTTQCIGKSEIDLTNVDLASFSSHKIYGIKGIGGLIKKEDILIEPMILGGKSASLFRSGTPSQELICSFAKALELVNTNFSDKVSLVNKHNERLRMFLSQFSQIVINSTSKSVSHVLNFSTLGVDSEKILQALSEKNIFISTKSACSSDNPQSLSILNLTKDEERASTSIRVSLSHLTTEQELDIFEKEFTSIYQELGGK
jgi:cysteine desulfurase